MKKFIEVSDEVRHHLEKVFDVGAKTVYNALNYVGDSDLCRRIRVHALQRGGVVMVVQPEMETIHTSRGMMRQTFPNGAMIDVDLHDGRLELRHNGVLRSVVERGCTVMELYVLQELAASL